ncbi:hypothetical protein BSKO_02236 [Bryopsis sp. KO-2023]|nr:hypothetical protein BSKO_02236 [Bryopsis sp. KO-2023]
MAAMKSSAIVLLLVLAAATSTTSASRVLQQGRASVSAEGGGSTALSLSVIPEFPYIPVVETDFSHVITIQAPQAIANADRAPVSLTAVLDRSGSMSGSKIDLLKRSTEFLVDQLQEGDSIGIVSYASEVSEDVPLTPVTGASKESIQRSIDNIRASGSTNLSGGLFKGVQQQKTGDIPQRSVKSVIMLTDGVANQGITDITEIKRKLAQELGSRNAPIVYALGFGTGHDVEFLQEIARTGEGSYVFIENESVIATSFGDIIGGLLTVTAQKIKVTLTPRNGGRITSMKGGKVTPSPTSWITEFPDLFAEEKRDILIDMKLPASSSSTNVVLEAKVEFFDVVKGQDAVQTIVVVVDRRKGPTPTVADETFEVTRLRFKVADDITAAVAQKEAGDTATATATLDGTLSALSASSASSNGGVASLRADVEKVKSSVSQDEVLAEGTAAAFSSGAASLKVQRGFGASALSSSSARTSSQTASADAASAFVGGGK